MAATVSARNWATISAAASGSVWIRLRAASEVKATPESRGPSPSWSSRRSRRRSSSTAAIVWPAGLDQVLGQRPGPQAVGQQRARSAGAPARRPPRTRGRRAAARRRARRCRRGRGCGCGWSRCRSWPGSRRRPGARRTAPPAPRGSPAEREPGPSRSGRPPGMRPRGGPGARRRAAGRPRRGAPPAWGGTSTADEPGDAPPSAPRLGSLAPSDSRSAEPRTKTLMQVTNATAKTTTRTTRPRRSTRSGSVAPTYMVGPTKREARQHRPGGDDGPATRSVLERERSRSR